MKNPTYATFMNEVDNYISSLSKDELKRIILNLGENQNSKSRNEFLQNIKGSNRQLSESDESIIIPDNSPDKFIKQIKKYKKRIENGEFYDEEESYRAYDREDHSHWRRNDYYNDYYDDKIDFSDEEYVLDAITFLEQAKDFFRHQDIKTALKAYEILFDIFENPDYYGGEYFIYGFSFDEAIDTDVLREHKTIYLRCQYVRCKDHDDFKKVYQELRRESDIFLSDLIEIDRNPLPKLAEFINGFIQFLSDDAKSDLHLVDVLFIKGGVEEVKKYAYAHGNKHPSVFLHYYEFAKEDKSLQSDLLKITLDGIKIIPEKYYIRSYLGLDLISIAKILNDKHNLLIGYSTAFFSNPTLQNMTYYIDFISSENNNSELDKLKNHLKNEDITSPGSTYYFVDHFNNQQDIFSLDTTVIDTKALIIGRFLLDRIENLIDFINPKNYLGFKEGKKYVAIISALTLKAISKEAPANTVDKLLNHYCFDIQSDEYYTLNKLVKNRVNNLSLNQQFKQQALDKIESLAVNRVSHILRDKLRGGYDSACLLLVACAEIKQLISKDGNELLASINNKYKRFSAFRTPLKILTAESSILNSIK